MSASIVRENNPARLKVLLAVLFLALALPTAAVVWQAYDQLKWEAWFQYRNQAESLTGSIDAAIANQMQVVESRSFADFEFVSATATANVVQRSPLSTFPAPQDVPGVIGFFQIDPDGQFSTPLVPDAGTQAETYGIAEPELVERTLARDNLHRILRDNALVREPVAGTGGRMQEAVRPAGNDAAGLSAWAIAEENTAAKEIAPVLTSALEELDVGIDVAASDVAVPEPQTRDVQDRFDQLNQPARTPATELLVPAATIPESEDEAVSREGSLGKLEDLQLDLDLQKRSESLDRDLPESVDERKNRQSAPLERARRVELTTGFSAPKEEEPDGTEDPTITTFQSEIDPYQFSLLDSGHMVLFRNAWRDNQRFIQGLLIDQASFTREIIEAAFRSSNLAAMSNLIVGYQDDVIAMFPGNRNEQYSGIASDFTGDLLYRARLSAPLDGVELVYAINELPPGPGATVLGWTTVIISLVFLGGFFALYRLGMGQIQLARQQQDFVSAVSHELKTPLTSIRMYGEMLKEGWADADKQKQYFEYIHDESERLTRLISNVLQLARITRNEPQFDMQSVNAAALVDQVRSKISHHVERAGFELAISIDDSARSLSIHIDADCFAQVVINLVDNAIKFSRDAETKRIEIEGTVNSNDEVQFSVRDFGPGIDKGQLKKIFRLFYRSESELTRETVGTGIGLAIVHQLVTAMHGKVDVRNCDPGAEFRVTFAALTTA